MKILILRPQPGADATARRVRAAGFEPVVMPLFAIEPLEVSPFVPSDYDAILLTSGNAVRAAEDSIKYCSGLPVYAVGSATAAALENIATQASYVGNEGIDQLLKVAKSRGHKRHLWLAGEDHSIPSAQPEIEVKTVIAYRSAPLAPPLDFAQILSECHAVMLHSTRAATRFAQLCDDVMVPKQHIRIGAFSQIVADNAGEGWADVAIASSPNDTRLLSEMQRHFTIVSRDP